MEDLPAREAAYIGSALIWETLGDTSHLKTSAPSFWGNDVVQVISSKQAPSCLTERHRRIHLIVDPDRDRGINCPKGAIYYEGHNRLVIQTEAEMRALIQLLIDQPEIGEHNLPLARRPGKSRIMLAKQFEDQLPEEEQITGYNRFRRAAKEHGADHLRLAVEAVLAKSQEQ